MKRDKTVYVAAAWWSECDAHTGVISLTPAGARKAIEAAMADEAVNGQEDDMCACGDYVTDDPEAEHAYCGLDAQRWSGVHAESLRQVLAGYGARQRRDIIDALRTDGVAYQEVN